MVGKDLGLSFSDLESNTAPNGVSPGTAMVTRRSGNGLGFRVDLTGLKAFEGGFLRLTAGWSSRFRDHHDS